MIQTTLYPVSTVVLIIETYHSCQVRDGCRAGVLDDAVNAVHHGGGHAADAFGAGGGPGRGRHPGRALLSGNDTN